MKYQPISTSDDEEGSTNERYLIPSEIYEDFEIEDDVSCLKRCKSSIYNNRISIISGNLLCSIIILIIFVYKMIQYYTNYY